MNKFTLTFLKDSEAGVWIVTSEELSGLVAESRDITELFNDLGKIVPTILEENNRQ